MNTIEPIDERTPTSQELYPLVAGRVQTRSLEIHIVDHCHLRCWGCCSLSPYLPEWYIDPADMARELWRARRILTPTWFKLVGGEPLLHPQIDVCLAIARSSEIAEIVSVTTNGFLLPKMSERFWQLTQALTLSLYPQPALPQGTIRFIAARARAHKVRLNWKQQDQFVDMDLPAPRVDTTETREIFQRCWLRRRCHILSRGRFYNCTRPPHFHAVLKGQTNFQADGIELTEDANLADRLREYLLATEPMRACARCRGGDAAMRPARQMSPEEVQQRKHEFT